MVDYLNGERYNLVSDDWYLINRILFDLNYEVVLNNDVKVNILFYWSEIICDYWCYNVDMVVLNVVGCWVYIDVLIGNNCSFERLGIESRLSVD